MKQSTIRSVFYHNFCAWLITPCLARVGLVRDKQQPFYYNREQFMAGLKYVNTVVREKIFEKQNFGDLILTKKMSMNIMVNLMTGL